MTFLALLALLWQALLSQDVQILKHKNLLITFGTHTANSGATPVASSSIDTTGSNLLIVGCKGSGAGYPTLGDSKSNMWTALTGQNFLGLSSIRLFYSVSPTVGAGHTFTCTHPTDAFMAVLVLTFSGATVTPFDKESGATNQDAGGGGCCHSFASGSVTPMNDNSLVVSMWGMQTAGFGGDVSSSNVGSLTDHFTGVAASVYQIQTSSTAINSTWQVTNEAQYEATAVAVFH